MVYRTAFDRFRITTLSGTTRYVIARKPACHAKGEQQFYANGGATSTVQRLIKEMAGRSIHASILGV
jgi:hypothetical protein